MGLAGPIFNSCSCYVLWAVLSIDFLAGSCLSLKSGRSLVMTRYPRRVVEHLQCSVTGPPAVDGPQTQKSTVTRLKRKRKSAA